MARPADGHLTSRVWRLRSGATPPDLTTLLRAPAGSCLDDLQDTGFFVRQIADRHVSRSQQ